MLGRIDLAPGYYVLPRQSGYYPAAFVSATPFGPDQADPEPVSAGGEFNAVYYDWPWGAETWEYTYEQEYTLAGQPFRINVYFSFYSEDGHWPAEQVADNDFQMTGTAYIGPGEDWITEQQPYSNCGPPPAYRIDVLTRGGDRIVLDKRHCWACACAGNTSCYLFNSAEVEMGDYSATVDDHFSLVYSAGHHNEGEVFLVFLAEPAGDTEALRVHAPPLASPEGGVVFYLDGSLDQIRSGDITQWEVSY